MIKSSLLKLILISLVILIMAWFSYGVWRYKVDKKVIETAPITAAELETVKIDVDQEKSEIFETEVDTSDWKTYRNEEWGFEIKYPENFIVRESSIVSCPGVSFWDKKFLSSRNGLVKKIITFDIFVQSIDEKDEKCIGGHYSQSVLEAPQYKYLGSEMATINNKKFLKKNYIDIVPSDEYQPFNFSSWHIKNKDRKYTILYNNNVTKNPEPHEELFIKILSTFNLIH